MTRQSNQTIHCPNCEAIITMETSFGRWIRKRKDLDSHKEGIVCSDVDYIVHRYKVGRDGRNVQCIMFIEVKTIGTEPRQTQQDTLHLLDQFLNNRRETPTKRNAKRRLGSARNTAYSVIAAGDVTVWAFGGYILQFEHTGPHDSGWIRWGPKRREISEDQLAALLRFDLDPDTLAPLEIRSHHASAVPPLFSGIPLDSR